MEDIKNMHGNMDKCVYKLGVASGHAAGASQTSKKQFLDFLTCLDLQKLTKMIKTDKNDIKMT